MKNTIQMDEPIYGVVLTDSQRIDITELKPQEDIFDCARRAIECETIEIVETEALGEKGCVLLIDEEGKLKDGDLFINCIASYLYNAQEHGDAIIGNAVIVKSAGESLAMLTGAEALKLMGEMSQIRSHAIQTIAHEMRIPPMLEARGKPSLSASLHSPSEKDRQPCKHDPMER